MRLPRIGILLTLLALVPANRASAQEQETDLADGPVFVARDTEPVLKNQTAVLQMLGRVYPNQLRLTGQEATVVLWLLVEEDGTVGACQVLKSGGNPGFDEAAQEVAGIMEFEPATLGGEPVAVWIQQAIKFQPGDPKIREQ